MIADLDENGSPEKHASVLGHHDVLFMRDHLRISRSNPVLFTSIRLNI